VQPTLKPMLAVPVTGRDGLPVDGATWAYEVKWDGVRVLAVVTGGRLRLLSRAGNDVTGGYPELAGLAALPSSPPLEVTDLVLDGEVVVLKGGVPSFSALAERMHVREPRRVAALAAAAPATFVAFDVLRSGGDVTGQTWQQRRTLLEALPASASWLVSPAYDDRDLLVTAAQEQGLEGVVAKRRSSRYVPGGRTGDWVKLAFKQSRSVVVGGWRWEVGARDRIGALLVGTPDGSGGFAFRGRVGSGLTGSGERRLRELLGPLQRPDSAFRTEVPAVDGDGAVWTDPVVVVDVRSLGLSGGGRLRQPVLLAVRDDLTPADLAPADLTPETVAGGTSDGDDMTDGTDGDG